MCLHQSHTVTPCHVLKWTAHKKLPTVSQLWQMMMKCYINGAPYGSPLFFFCFLFLSHHFSHRAASAFGSVSTTSLSEEIHLIRFLIFLLLFPFLLSIFVTVPPSNTQPCRLICFCLSFLSSPSASPMPSFSPATALGAFWQHLHSLARDALRLWLTRYGNLGAGRRWWVKRRDSSLAVTHSCSILLLISVMPHTHTHWLLISCCTVWAGEQLVNGGIVWRQI